jgi:PAS domain S-box-containing protein
MATLPPGKSPPATLDFALLRGALEEVPFGVATTRGAKVLYANEALTRMFAAPPGMLETKQVWDLFAPDVFVDISKALEERRVFDGRVRARAFDGRDFDVEVHLQWYASEAQGMGGFVIVRDVSLELSALSRMVEQLGGALFRVRVGDGALESVSPAIARLTGLDPAKCTQRPVLLTTLLSSEERERIAFLYRRMARGELLTASAQVSVRRADGVTRLVQLRAAARRDTNGLVRHIDGVVIDAARDPEGAGHGHDPARGEHGGAEADPTARATMDLTYEMLREASQHMNALFREVRSIRAALKTHAASLPPDVAAELHARLDAVAASAGATGALNRGVRHALARATMGATLAEVLDSVRATLAPAIGDRAVTIDAGDAASLVIPERVDELTLALTHLGLRAFRFAGSGTLRISARRAGPPSGQMRPRPGAIDPRRAEHAIIEVLGSAPPDVADSMQEISGDMLRTVPRPDEADIAYAATSALLAAAGGAIESDDTTFATARSVVRIRV